MRSKYGGRHKGSVDVAATESNPRLPIETYLSLKLTAFAAPQTMARQSRQLILLETDMTFAIETNLILTKCPIVLCIYLIHSNLY